MNSSTKDHTKQTTKNFSGGQTAEKFVPEFPPSEDEEDKEDVTFDETGVDDSEEIQEQEEQAGFQNDDEEWEDELTGERSDNGYLPGQRLAEHANFPKLLGGV